MNVNNSWDERREMFTMVELKNLVLLQFIFWQVSNCCLKLDYVGFIKIIINYLSKHKEK